MGRTSRVGTDGSSRRAIVGALAERGPLSRSELSGLTGIGAATVGTQVRRLLRLSLVRELAPQTAGTGRPRVPVELADRARVVGVSIEAQRIVVVATGLNGRIVAERRAPFNPALKDLRPVADAVRAVTAEAGECLAVGVSLSGVVDEEHDAVVVSVVLGWHDLAVGSVIGRWLGLPVHVENDVLALASRELAFGALGPQDAFLLIALGDGIGMAIVAGRSVFRGDGESSSEFAHVSVGPGGGLCRCGSVGCLQTVAGLEEMIAAAPLRTDDPRTLAGLTAAAERGDRAVLEHLRAVGEVVGRAVGGSATLLGIRTLLVTGEGICLWPYLRSGFDASLGRHTTTLRGGPVVATIPWSDTAGAAGAAGLALARSLDVLS